MVIKQECKSDNFKGGNAEEENSSSSAGIDLATCAYTVCRSGSVSYSAQPTVLMHKFTTSQNIFSRIRLTFRIYNPTGLGRHSPRQQS